MAYYQNRNNNKRKYQRESRGGGVWDFGGSIFNWLASLSPETKKGIFVIFLFVVGALSVLGLFDLSGSFGQGTNYLLSIGFGNIKWLFPLLIGAWIFFLLNEEKYPIRPINYIGVVLFIFALCGLFHMSFDSWNALKAAKDGLGGGYAGASVALPLVKYMNFWGALVILVAALLVGLLLALETSIYGFMWPIKLVGWLWNKFKDWRYYQKMKQQQEIVEQQEESGSYEEEPATAEGVLEDELPPEEDDALPFTKIEVKTSPRSDPEDSESVDARPKKFGPLDIPIGLLNSTSGKATAGDIKNNQEIIKKTLANFGIPVEMGEINIGPTFTQFTMRPIDGVRLSRITVLNSDLSLSLAAHPIRIEAPIPGRALVGIEVPNVQTARVNMGEMLLSKEYKSRPNNLSLALGKDVSGRAVFASLDKMPHLLIAGATGSGKSVCVNSVIVSLMYQNSPDELKFILVDPKRVELPLYNGTPYLLTPVINDVKKTIGALKWAITEMERRFELLAKFGNRNIASYNQTHSDKLPYIVIVIDELADLMATNANDMEAGIVRLAQMARAVGIHLILATQRPSTEVITGLIKANIPARISFSVASSIDSRTILDGTGAEKLVGRGDMLYLGPEYSKPKRIQGVYLSDKEISDVIRFIKSHGEAQYEEKLMASTGSSFGGGGGSFGNDSDEPLLPEVIELIRESGKASASLLQRRLKLGYARAARILDLLEEQGMIGPADGAKPREVFLDRLGGVDAVTFAAREHGLTGELRPDIDDEPSFTAFRPVSESVEEEPAEIMDEADELPLDADIAVEDDFMAAEEDTENETQTEDDDKNDLDDDNPFFASSELGEKREPEVDEPEELQGEPLEPEVEAEEEEEEEIPPVKKTNGSKKKFFGDEEWS